MKPARMLFTAILLFGAAWTTPALAHCDALDGPVVAAAQRSLASGEVAHSLIWVSKADEMRIRRAFDKAAAARKAGAPRGGAADQAFFATLVRVHREGEGEKFTGLKPAGTIAPPVAAADSALGSGSVEPLQNALVERIVEGLRDRYAAVRSRGGFDPADVAAGRAYVAAYVDYVHFVERVSDAAAVATHGHPSATHGEAAAPKPAHAH